MITIYHLTRSRSERIVWLLEELDLPYKIQTFEREPNGAAPAAMKEIHPIGRAPIIRDGDVVIAESGAIIEYLARRYAGGRLDLGPEDTDFARYLHWLHFSEGSLMTVLLQALVLSRVEEAAASPVKARIDARVQQYLAYVDGELAARDYLSGTRFTAADIMMEFPFGTLQHFMPVDLAPYARVAQWLARIRARPAYLKAMAIADPGRR